ncbi:hypothetical protein F971_00154 [Acinetobacter vivianii]|uniref:2OG-Fe dioxygenase family protein n=1 Tax=Acinetobacter vivianii TaxID=1776742 RepID=N8WG85_9GAMM|nr:2OG-Fe dioxygenase family protein [Acinetobacter vivianii]ENU94257.1 hypothetical protein F971_00154 [Acinetobacter vivianii]
MGHLEQLSYLKLGLSSENLLEEGYQFLPGSAWIFPSYLSKFWDQLVDSWNYLELDTYMKKGDIYRYRKFGRFIYDDTTGHVQPIINSSFYQSKTINQYAGDVERSFTHLDDNIYKNRFLHYIIASSLHHFIETYKLTEKKWEVTLHQFRILATKELTGLPTPEGIHQDGHKFISMHLINRQNVNGGISSIYNSDKDKLSEITLKKPMDSLFLNDELLYHSVSPITPKSDDTSYRDILVIDYNIAK